MSLEFRRSTALHCDEVFDILTRGPFPTGHESDDAVERHLSGCHECRVLAEALSPAVQLFHEALSPGEGKELPGYRGVYSTSAVADLPAALREAMFDDSPVASSATSLAVSPLTQARGQDPWRLAAVLGWAALVVLLMVGVIWQSPRGLFTAAPAANETRVVKYQPTDAGREWLAALNLPAVCFHAPALSTSEPLLADGISRAEAGHDCCLRCHGPSSANRPPLEAQASLDRTCHVCHNY